MSSRQIFKGASILTLSQIIIAVCTFVRNILVARMISVEDYGIATTFAITLAMVEMASNLAFDKILVQDERGGDDDMLASVHFVHFLKSLATGLVLLLVAPLMASLFDLHDLVWAFQILALIPVLRGLSHFDLIVSQRYMHFLPTAIADAVPQVLAVAIAYPFGVWLGDYRVMLFLVLLQPAAFTVLSHFYAKRPYRWLIRRDLIKKKLGFAWPLLVNGILMFAVLNGDKAIVSHSYSMEVLGWYSVAFGLTLMPTLLFTRICSVLLLPVLSKNFRDNKERFGISCTQSVAFCSGVASFSMLVFLIAGSTIIYICYGERYMEGTKVIGLLGVMQAVRIILLAPTIIAISYSHTKNAMYSNIVRVVVIPIAIYFALSGFNVEWIVMIGILGELLALAFCTYLLELGDSAYQYLRATFFNVLLFVVLALAAYILIVPLMLVDGSLPSLLVNIFIGVLVASIGLVLHLVFEKELRVIAIQKIRSFRS